jgi:cyanophycinase-like exopeptidase
MQPLTVPLAVSVNHLVLIGGGEFSFGETRAIDDFLIRSMPPNRRTIAFLPTASGSAEYATHIGAYWKGIDPSVETINVPIYRGRDNRRQKSLNMLFESGMIYVGGGVPNNLLGTVRESPAELTMRDAAKNGTLIAAIGAAAACFGIHARGLDGFGWLANTVIDTGFDPQNDENMRRMMSLPDAKLGIGIPTQTALSIRSDGTTEIVGNGTVAVFRKG